MHFRRIMTRLAPHRTSALVVLWSALLWGHWFFASPAAGSFVRIPSWARMTSSALLVLLATLSAAAANTAPTKRFARAMAYGMAFGCLGDLCLAGWFPLSTAAAFCFGMGAFAVGHVAYLVAFRMAGAPNAVAIAVCVLSATLGWTLVVLPGQSPAPELSYGALLYGILLATMTGWATGLALADRTFRLLAVGAVLFFVSDLVLSLQLFRPDLFRLFPDSLRGDVVWLLYGHGQLLLITHTARGCTAPQVET